MCYIYRTSSQDTAYIIYVNQVLLQVIVRRYNVNCLIHPQKGQPIKESTTQ